MEEHFSIAEAAAELHMTEAAVLRACLNEQLDLSIRFSGRNLPQAKLRRQLPMEAGYPPRRVKTAPLGLYDRTFTLGSDRSLWTLVMVGSGRLCVEDEYQKAIGRTPAISNSSPSSSLGVFVSIPDESMPEPGYVELRELVEYRGTAIGNAIRYDEDFHAVHFLPAGSELVVAKKALVAYQAKRSPDTTAGRKAAMIEVMHKPEWSVWREVLRVTLREAVSLSCNADPKAVALGPVESFVAGFLPQFAVSDDVNSEISRRLTIARSHAGTGGTLPTVKEDEHTYVQLATFSDWAMNVVKWPVPDEMREMVSTARPAPAPRAELTPGATLHETDQDAGSRVAWRVAVKNQWSSMLQAHDQKYPGPKKALAWFKANDQEGTFKPATQNEADDKFRWVGSDSKVRTAALKTFQNAISEMQLPT